jgi:putative heme-binding domain-containing protein
MQHGPRPLTVLTVRRAIVCIGLACVLVCARLLAQAPPQNLVSRYDAADVEAGSRLYAAQCAPCHGTNGDMIDGVDFRHRQFKTVVTDQDLARVLATGRPAAGMPSFATLAAADVTSITAFLRAGFDPDLTAGDVGKGRAIFSGKGGCATCHRVGAVGPRVASDLTDIGAIRTAGALRRAILNPATSLPPGSRTVRAVTKSGQTIRGRRLNEDTYTVQLIDEQERFVSLNKADLRSYEITRDMTMPSAASRLTPDEVSDLIAYLQSLKGVQP